MAKTHIFCYLLETKTVNHLLTSFPVRPFSFLTSMRSSSKWPWTDGLLVLFLLFSGDSFLQSESMLGKWRWSTCSPCQLTHLPLGGETDIRAASSVRVGAAVWLFALEISRALIQRGPTYLSERHANFLILTFAPPCRNCETFSLWKSGRRARVSTVHDWRHAESLPEWIPQVSHAPPPNSSELKLSVLSGCHSKPFPLCYSQARQTDSGHDVGSPDLRRLPQVTRYLYL